MKSKKLEWCTCWLKPYSIESVYEAWENKTESRITKDIITIMLKPLTNGELVKGFPTNQQILLQPSDYTLNSFP